MSVKAVTLWYEAFNKRDPRVVESVLSEGWVDIPAAPGQPSGLEGLKHILVLLTTAFPDLNVRIEEMLDPSWGFRRRIESSPSRPSIFTKSGMARSFGPGTPRTG